MTDSSPTASIRDLFAQLRPGGVVQHRPVENLPGTDAHFFRVYQSWDYAPGRLDWTNKEQAFIGSRRVARDPLSDISVPKLTFDGPVADVVDFYDPNNELSFVSRSLIDLFEELDPGSLEVVETMIEARDGVVEYFAVLPSRVIEAIDVRRTEIVIRDLNLAGEFIPELTCPEGVVFDEAALADIQNFCDLDIGGWYWSATMLLAAEKRGVKGLYAKNISARKKRKFIRL